jgi:nitroimidazol reductase NimA-like FMN-containing flavoprotein (pyridoxamine 5'-phosphate oxidase superfamily)
MGGMTSWSSFVDEAPDLAAAILARFVANTHHVLATIRSDGSPRVSGTEIAFHDGQLCLGSMWEARKATDLRRDPRLALHANPSDPEMAGGDAKISGRAVEVIDERAKQRFVDDVFANREAPPSDEPFHLFTVELGDAVLVEVDTDEGVLVIRRWRPGARVEVHRRR